MDAWKRSPASGGNACKLNGFRTAQKEWMSDTGKIFVWQHQYEGQSFFKFSFFKNLIPLI